MYPLGKQFSVNSSAAVGNKKYTVQGAHFRITILSEMIVRLEYSPNGAFNDRPTQLVRRRNFSEPDFQLQQDENIMIVTTRYFTLTYLKDKPFKGPAMEPGKYLKVTLNAHEKERQKDWFYGAPEAYNLGGNIVSSDVDVLLVRLSWKMVP